ncbi:hypothetical protein WICMUC_005572 [Wickerhamomyces mucosus]|uniref:Uncharacterized protein n=1 Tax=Wickerhamomyces mucosus TaxID=1378264 RepID=A0A9P8T535_9ASCO|nr:hypothetical protein WICMUC_005572 [Wickerhamomyces mucosus]
MIYKFNNLLTLSNLSIIDDLDPTFWSFDKFDELIKSKKKKYKDLNNLINYSSIDNRDNSLTILKSIYYGSLINKLIVNKCNNNNNDKIDYYIDKYQYVKNLQIYKPIIANILINNNNNNNYNEYDIINPILINLLNINESNYQFSSSYNNLNESKMFKLIQKFPLFNSIFPIRSINFKIQSNLMINHNNMELTLVKQILNWMHININYNNGIRYNNDVATRSKKRGFELIENLSDDDDDTISNFTEYDPLSSSQTESIKSIDIKFKRKKIGPSLQ